MAARGRPGPEPSRDGARPAPGCEGHTGPAGVATAGSPSSASRTLGRPASSFSSLPSPYTVCWVNSDWAGGIWRGRDACPLPPVEGLGVIEEKTGYTGSGKRRKKWRPGRRCCFAQGLFACLISCRWRTVEQCLSWGMCLKRAALNSFAHSCRNLLHHF